jgi:hypothetical protein
MATLNDLRHLRPEEADGFAATEWNPFLGDDILSGAQVLQVRHDALRSSLHIILELRVSEYDWQACAGLISASEVTDCTWSQDFRGNGLMAWTILSSTSNRSKEALTLELSGTPTFSLRLTAGQAAFYSAKIEGMEGFPPPDYTAADAIQVETEIPNWDSKIHDVKVSYSP